jgi:hypothetical protein
VQLAQGLGRHVVAPVDDGGRPGVGAAGFGLLLVGQGHDPQGEDLVDLQGVVEVTGALGGHLGVVVEDDRRGQHHVVIPDEDRVGPVAVTGVRRPGGVAGRIEQGHESAVVDGQHRVHGDQAVPHGVVAVPPPTSMPWCSRP